MGAISAAARRAILRRVFRKGVESVPEEALDKLFKSSRATRASGSNIYDQMYPMKGDKVYRVDTDPKRLFEEGFRKDLKPPFTPIMEDYLIEKGYTLEQIDKFAREGLSKKLVDELKKDMKPSASVRDLYDEPGLYWATRKSALKEGVPEYKRGLPKENLVEGIVGASTSVKGSLANEDKLMLREGFEVIQTAPKQVLARTKDKEGNWIYKIIGGVGAAGVGANTVLKSDEVGASPRSELLKRIFEKGVKSVDKRVLDKLFRDSKDKVYRFDETPHELLKGWNPKRLGNTEGELVESNWDIPGLYFGDTKKGVQAQIGLENPKDVNVQGLMRPGAKVQEMVYPWTRMEGNWEAPEVDTKADFIRRILETPRGRTNVEYIQQKPNNTLVKVGDKYRILGASGAVGAGTVLLDENQAEAGMSGKILKAGVKAIAGMESSASKRLVGTPYKGSTIAKITQGKGEHRYITTASGETDLVDASYVNTLAKRAGTGSQIEKFAAEDSAGRLAQAYKALDMRLKQQAFEPEAVIDFHKAYKDQLIQGGVEPEATILAKVQDKHITLPEEYGKLLEKEGILKIMKKL